MLKIEKLKKSFGGVLAINDVNLEFAPQSLTAIIGPNGAGKTTLFNLITGHLRPDTGRIIFNNRDVVGLHVTQIVREGIARAFQVANIFRTLTVEESVAAAVLAHQRRVEKLLQRFPPASAKARTTEVIELLGLQDSRTVTAQNLSHGDQKLLDIGLALAMEPKLLLLDEPTAGMGAEERWQIIETVKRLWEAENMTLVFIEHNMDIVFDIAQTVRVLRYGSVLAEGTPDEIRNNAEVIEAYLGTAREEESA